MFGSLTPMLAQIGFLDFFVGQKLRAGAAHSDTAGFQHVGKIRGFQGHIGVLLNQQYGDALRLIS